jgi:hypothetical protein
MNGSGCKNCPVEKCETMRYRGSTCAAQRAKLGLGDPETNWDRIRSMTPRELAEWLLNMDVVCRCCDTPFNCGKPYEEVTKEHCLGKIVNWLEQEVAE